MTEIDILSKLVSFPVLGGESNLEIIHWIKDYVESHGITTTLVPNKNGDKASLHCRIGPAVDGGVILSGHTDVVPVEGQEWSTNPFELIDKGDGNLYARGSCDMKGFVACCLAALPDMVKADLKKPIYFAFSYDEEVGCLAAPELIEHIQKTYSEEAQYAIIGEASMMHPIIGQKGIYIMDVYVNGSAGHSSRIKQEVSAIHEAAKLIVWIENKMDDLISKNSDDRFQPPHSSLHVGQMKGGIAANVIADQAWFTLDIRIIPKDDLEAIISDFTAFCRQREELLHPIFPDFKIEIKENHPPVPPLDASADSKIVKTIGELTGNYEWSTVAYAAEAGQFANGGYECVICGPGSISMAHRADEYVSKQQLTECVQMIRKLAHKLSDQF
jgi:acetylornithine deacetylase